MINTQTQIDSLIDLAVLQRTELKQLVDSLPQLRDHLSSEIERNLEEIEPAIRSELEQFVAARALDTQAKTSAELSAKLDAMARNLESTTAAKYSVLMAERAQNATLLAQAEARIAEAASALPGAVKGIVTDELSRFPRAGEIDQLRKEFAEPRGLNPRGRWQVGDTYNKLDLVSYNGDSYVSNTDGNREKPSRSSEAWTLSAARGNGGAGGGVTSLTDLVAVPANGELLIGNGSAFVNNTITGGTGVTVTNGPGTITIDASGAQEILTATVTNAESFAITRGQVVYLFGATGNRASVKLADNSNDAASSKTFGVVSEASIAAGANGLVTCVGVVDKLTLGSYTEGDVLYLGATPGAVTNVKPYAPNHLVYVGMVERANNGNGELYVRIQNGFELDEIHDVQITTPPLAGSLLMRDATTSLWKANRLTGTANQVTVTNADTSVTLSLPTAIANVNSVTAATTQNLTLAGGSTGASLVLGQGAAAANVTLNATTSGFLSFTKSEDSITPSLARFLNTGATTAGRYNEIIFGKSLVNGGAGTIGYKSDTATPANSRLFLLHYGNNQDTAGINLTNTGNLLIGTTTDGGQKLQVNGSAAIAGAVTVNAISGINALAAGTQLATFESSVNGAAVELITKGKNSTGTARQANIGINRFADDVLSFSNGTTESLRLHLTTQAATFAGAVTASSNVKMGSGTAVALGSQFVVMDGGSEARLQINSTDRPGIYLTAAGVNVATLRGNATTTELITSGGTPLSINNSSLAATFAGAVTIAGTAVTLSGVTPVIDMGSKTSANNPIIDFNSSGNSNDFDVRLAAKGGTSPSGTGTLTVHGTLAATASNVGAFLVGDSGTGTPTAATSVAIGGGNVNAGGKGTFGGQVIGGGGINDSLYYHQFAGSFTSSGSPIGLFINPTLTPGAATSNNYNLATQGTLNKPSGTAAVAAGAWFIQPTIGAGAGGTFTDAATVYINGAPTGGVTNSALVVAAGASLFRDTTPSTGAGSGALQVAGGIYSGAASVFGGTVTTTSTGFSAINASGSVEFIGSRSSTGSGVTVTYKTGATLNWFHGLRGLVDNNWYLFNNGTSTNTLIFDYGTNAATFAGTVIAPAATTAISSVRLPHGTAPTSPVNGDMWTTTAGLYVRINGVTVGPLS